MKKDKTDGFTLVELLVVLVIAALALSVLASNPFGRPRPQSAAALARQISVAIAALEARALSTASSLSVVVDVATHAVIIGQNRIDLPPNVRLSVKTGAELIVEDGKGMIVFFPDGTSSGGEIILGEPSGPVSIVRVNWITGAVDLIGAAS